jgi:putative DNA primase/helicase
MDTPFQRAARAYFDSGWSPIPLPHQAKSPVPDKPTPFTGAKGAYVDGAQLRKWLGERARAHAGKLAYPPSNIALRSPKDIIWIDVDAYGEKRGAETLARAEAEWGPLPPTWVSTSRSDGVSGIRPYRIPEGLSWPGKLPQGEGIELVRWDHRYVIVEPSIHDKTHEPYCWWKQQVENGVVVMVPSTEEFPDADASDIPALPEAWIAGLTSGKRWEERAVDEELTARDIQDWINARVDIDNPCSHMRKLVTKAKVAVQSASDDGGMHDSGRDHVWGMLNDAKAGHAGISKALSQVRAMFLKFCEGRRDSARVAAGEWARMVARGVAKVTMDPNEESDKDPCATISASVAPVRLGGAHIEDLNGLGDANRAMRVFAGNVRWVPGWGEWVIWRDNRWRVDSGQARRWVWKAIDQMSEEAALLAGEEDGEAKAKRHMAHRKSRLEDSKIKAILETVKDRNGISVEAWEFDANPRIMVCPNGTVELTEAGVKFRPSRIEDYTTLVTGAPYVEGATHELWDDYLTRFQPDPEVRDWLQRLVGYSLLGSNPEQFLIVGLGPTSTGKTTFTEGLFSAIGGYGGPLEASVLKTSVGDSPRPDILKALTRRVVIAEELSEFQNLHVDQVKRITGAGTLSARGMNSNKYVERRAAFTPWLMTNEVPHIEGADAALKSRVLVVPFDVFQKRSRKASAVRERIITEAGSAILAWALAGWDKYLAGTDLRVIPPGAWKANGKFAEGMSLLHLFVSQKCELLEDASCPSAQLYEAYQAWCYENGIAERDVLNNVWFGRRITSMGTAPKNVQKNGKNVMHRVGIRLL